MTKIRRYSIGARGEKFFHEDGPHVSYEDYVKEMREVIESWGSAVRSSMPKTPNDTKNFWAKLGGDSKKL